MKQLSLNNTKQLVYTALGIALVFSCTAFVNIRLPIAANGGLIHLGNVPLFIIAVLYGRWTGALAGGVGMALFDIVGGWFLWAPFTLVIAGAIGYTVGIMYEKKRSLTSYATALLMAFIIKVAGYYGAETMIYGNWLAPVMSIPGNIIQIALAAIVVLPIITRLK